MKKTGLLFLLLTITAAAVLKYCCPQSAEQLREKAGEILSGNLDYSGVISAIGSFIKDEAEELQQASDEDSVVETMPEDMLQSYRSAMEQWVLALEEDKSSSMQQSNDEDLPPAVSACIAKQLSFAGQSIPKNVRLDMPELPFKGTVLPMQLLYSVWKSFIMTKSHRREAGMYLSVTAKGSPFPTGTKNLSAQKTVPIFILPSTKFCSLLWKKNWTKPSSNGGLKPFMP